MYLVAYCISERLWDVLSGGIIFQVNLFTRIVRFNPKRNWGKKSHLDGSSAF